MKKILFTLLLFTGFLQAQTYPVNPTKFGKISLNTNGVSTSTSKINTQEADGQINYINAANLPVSTATQIAIDGKVSDTIRDGINAIAPSENAVYDALQLKENLSNKATDFTTVNNTLYPTVQAAKNYIDLAISNSIPNTIYHETVATSTGTVSSVGTNWTGTTTSLTANMEGGYVEVSGVGIAIIASVNAGAQTFTTLEALSSNVTNSPFEIHYKAYDAGTDGVIRQFRSSDGEQVMYIESNGNARYNGLRIDSNGNVISEGFVFVHGDISLRSDGEIINRLSTMTPYTVATLPTPDSNKPAFATVNDALDPVTNTVVVGGGGETIPVFYNGVQWVVYIADISGKENISNKSSSYTTSSTTTYPNTKALVDGLATKQPLTANLVTAGTGLTNYLAKYIGVNSIGNSLIYENGGFIGINNTSPSVHLDVTGEIKSSVDITSPSIRLNRGTDTGTMDKMLVGYSGDGVQHWSDSPQIKTWLGIGTYAPLDSPALTGIPTAPTATAGTNTTQIATTAFVSSSNGWVKSSNDIYNSNSDNVLIGTTSENPNSSRVVIKQRSGVGNESVLSFLNSSGVVSGNISISGSTTNLSFGGAAFSGYVYSNGFNVNSSGQGFYSSGTGSYFQPRSFGWNSLGKIRYENTESITDDKDLTSKVYVDRNRLKTYTFATLPASPVQGDSYAITDALAPAYLAPAAGGGSVFCPVVWNGTNWVCH